MATPRKKTKTTGNKIVSKKKKKQLPYDKWQECLINIEDFENEVDEERSFINTVIHPLMTIYRNRLIRLCEIIQVNIEVMPYTTEQKTDLLEFMKLALMNAMLTPGEMTDEEQDSYRTTVEFLLSKKVGFANLLLEPTESRIRNKRYYRRRSFQIDHYLAIKQLTRIEEEIPHGYHTKTTEFDDFLTDLYSRCLSIPKSERIKIPWLFDEEKCRSLLNNKFLERQRAWSYLIEDTKKSEDYDSGDKFQNELIKFRLKTLQNILETGDMALLKELEPTFVKEFDINQEDIEKQIANDDYTFMWLQHHYKCFGREIILTDPSNALVESYDLDSTFLRMKENIIEWGRITTKDNAQLQVWIDRFEQEIPSEKSTVDLFIYQITLLVSNPLIEQIIQADMESLTDDLDFEMF